MAEVTEAAQLNTVLQTLPEHLKGLYIQFFDNFINDLIHAKKIWRQ
jgi:hypothetical protein